MKNIFFVVFLAVLAAGAVSAQTPDNTWLHEAAGAVNVYLPGSGDFDLYKYGFGLEFQYRNWSYDPIGLALSLGAASWEVDDGAGDLGDIHKQFDGSVTLIPVGASVLLNLLNLENFSVIAELGLRYVVVDADVDFVRVVPGRDGGTAEVPSSLDVDDSVIGLFGLEADYFLTDRFLLFGSLGYQHDITRGDITTPTGDLRSNELRAYFARFGGKLLF